MDFTAEIPRKENPLLTSNIFGKLTFWWIKDIFWFRKTRNVTASDIYNVLPDHRSDVLCKKLDTAWEEEISKAEKKKVVPSFWRALIKTFLVPFLAILPIPFIYGTITIVQPLIVKPLISYFHVGSTTSFNQAMIYGTSIVVLMVIQIFIHRHGYHLMLSLGMRMRIACSSLIFKKICKLSKSSMSDYTEGSIINLISVDAAKFEYFLPSLYYTLAVPLQSAIAIYIMWEDIGVISLVGIAIMNIQCLPLLVFLYHLAKKFRVTLSESRDERVSLINEIVSGIVTLKMYVWEKWFEKMAFLTRSREIKDQMKLLLMDGLTLVTVLFAHRSSAFLTVLTFTLTSSESLTVEKVVSTVQILNTLMVTGSVYSMLCSVQAADVHISVKRMQKFLLSEEINRYIKRAKMVTQNGEVSISVRNASATWSKDSYALQNISVDINSNKLCCITGIVGSGKSTLLKLILDEFPPTSGEVHVHGKVSYASQESWLFPASVRDNIILGEEYNEEKYQTVIEACDLLADFNLLPYGDMTLVGNRGMALSGGQCARVNLARAVYKDAEIYLLDDPLAAVDMHVNKRIFQKCINGYLKNKTRVLVTHNIEHLKVCDKIILMKKGTIEFHGCPDEFIEFIEHLNYELNFQKDKPAVLNHENITEKQSSPNKVIEKYKAANLQETKELIAQGYIEKSVFWRYIRATDSFFLFFVMTISLLSSLSMFTFFDYYIVARSNEFETELKDFNNYTLEGKHYYILEDYSNEEKSLFFCGLILLAGFVLNTLSYFLYYYLFLKANKKIHNKMLQCVMRAPMKFFQTNTTGNILNRFSKDTMTADDMLLKTVINCLSQFIILVLSFIVIVIINWWSIIPLLIIMIIVTLLTKIFILTSLGFTRLEGNAKSPVLSIVTSCVTGLLTIRCCGAEDIFNKVFDMRQDYHTSAVYLNLSAAVAHELYSQLSIAAFFAVIVYSSIPLREHISASNVGYILANIIFMLQLFQYIMRIFAEAVIHMISVERMLQYTKLEQETSDDKIGIEMSTSWPDRGELRFKQVYLRYSHDGKPILKNLTFTAEPGSKIGIVGRTGAGKSSLISALFRLAEIDGSILIDGIDTKHINLSQLRSKISIIPQEPFLFTGSLRSNLDPMNKFDDAAIWSALRDVELNHTFSSLDYPIEKAGDHLSLGERQLICLARTLIWKNKILVLDEATANVDSTTDALIQKTIRTKFKDCTVLVIAHRLNTIMDSDKILVIDQGEMAEFDRPEILLQKKESRFAAMVQTSNNNSIQT